MSPPRDDEVTADVTAQPGVSARSRSGAVQAGRVQSGEIQPSTTGASHSPAIVVATMPNRFSHKPTRIICRIFTAPVP